MSSRHRQPRWASVLVFMVLAAGLAVAVPASAATLNPTCVEGTHFTRSGLVFTFTVNCNWTVPTGGGRADILVVAGGGGGAGGAWGGGGGAGGVVYATSFALTPGSSQTVTLGAGGSGGANNNNCTSNVSAGRGSNGGDSQFGSLGAVGGGGGGGYGWTTNQCGVGRSGGSGGGMGEVNDSTFGSSNRAASTQHSPTGATGYGNRGGGQYRGSQAGAGGGGAGAAAADVTAYRRPTNGGAGQAFSITGTSVTYAGGGGGGTTNTGSVRSSGGSGGGGAGGFQSSGVAGTNGLGGGGGGAHDGSGGQGGNGVVIVRLLGAAPTIVLQPASGSVETGTTRTFYVAATVANGEALSYQWQKAESTATSTWTNISGATSTVYTTPTLSRSADDGDRYRAVVTATVAGTTFTSTSNEAILTVNGPTLFPTISGTRYIVERFTLARGVSSWTVPAGVTSVDLLVVGGGGGGAGRHGGGGGAGGVASLSNHGVTAGQTYNITIGSGGVGGAAYSGWNADAGGAGGNSSFQLSGALSAVLTATGGSGGLRTNPPPGGISGAGSAAVGVTGAVNSTSRAGGAGIGNTCGATWCGGGGAGSSAVGGAASSSAPGAGGAGGAGTASSITGTSVTYAGGGGGGGGGSSVPAVATSAGGAGAAGGGAGGSTNVAVGATNCTGSSFGMPGDQSSGSGGGGGGFCNTVASSSSAPTSDSGAGGAGGSGIVVVRYQLPSLSDPDLDAASDSGESDTDNVTKNTALTFSGTAPVGAVVQLSTAASGTLPSGSGWTNRGSTCTANTSGAWSCTTSTLTEGTYAVRAVATVTIDGSNATLTSTNALAITIDTTAPTSTGSITATHTNGSSFFVNYSWNDNRSASSFRVFRSTNQDLSSPTLCNLAVASQNATSGTGGMSCGSLNSDATYYVYSSITDIAGNTEAVPTTADDSIIRDTVAPTASWTRVSSATSTSRTVSYTLTFAESVSGLAASDFDNAASSGASGCVFTPSASSVSASPWSVTVSITCTSDGVVTPRLLAGTVVDLANNPNLVASASSNVTIAAEITVTYDTQGGSSISSGTTLIGGSIALSPGTPTRAGFSFDGWFADDSGGTAITFPYTHGKSANFTLYAQWTASILTVTYDVRGGSGSVADGSTETGGVVSSLPAGTGLSRRGFDFDGWAASINGAKLSEPYTHGQSANFTLFARWTPKSLTVTYDLAGGTGPSGFSSTATTQTGGSLLTSPGTPTRSGFDFVGWSPVETGSPVKFPYVHNQTSSFNMYAVWRSQGEPNNVWFYPGAGPSNVMTLTAPSMLTPGFPRSTTVYTVSALVQTPLGVSGLDRVTMCWYKTGTGGGTSACANASTSPETEFLATWTEAEDTFSKTGTNHYALGAGVNASTATPTGSNVTVVFRFQVSNAMRAGSWAVLVTAIDDAGQSLSRSDTATVDSVFTVMTRPEKRFGVLPRSGSTTVNDTLVGEYATNADADFSIQATNFNCAGCDAGDALTLATTGSPTTGQVALDCSIGSTLDATPLRVTGATKKFGRSLTETGETTNKNNKMSCRLTYGGGAKKALVEYSNTVTFAVGAR